jgi:hypothetical protein
MKASVILVVAGLAVAKSAGTSMRSTGDANPLNFIMRPGSLPLDLQCSNILWTVTQGQPYGGTVCGVGKLEITAGREGSTPVANTFNAGLGARNMMYTNTGTYGSHDQTPEKLNFYIEADITFKLGSEDKGTYRLRIGQGHWDSGWWNQGNNWWIGGEHCWPEGPTIYGGSCGITCSSQGGQRITFPSAVSDPDIYVSFEGCTGYPDRPP